MVHPDQLVWVVVGDRAKIEPGLRELKLGEIRLIDTDGKPLDALTRAPTRSKPLHRPSSPHEDRPMPTSNATAVWEGGLKNGRGHFKAGSASFEGDYSFRTRFEGAPGTNPEELIAAAHAACLSMALSAGLEKNGTPATRISTKASCTVEKVGDGFKITGCGWRCEGRFLVSTRPALLRPRRPPRRDVRCRARCRATFSSIWTPNSNRPCRATASGGSRRRSLARCSVASDQSLHQLPEPLLQLRVLQFAVLVERLRRLRQREHVGEQDDAEPFQRHP